MRSTKSPDENADIGEHEFTFSYYPHLGNLEYSDVLVKAHELNDPVTIIPLKKVPKEGQREFFDIDSNTTKIETVKKSEDGKGIILRLYETMGMNDDVKLYFDENYEVEETNLIEEGRKHLKKKSHMIELSFKPFEIRTLYLKK